MLGGAAHRALADQHDQARFGELGDVVVRVAERDLQLVAEVAGGEDPAAVDAEDFEDRDAQRMGGGTRQALPIDRDRLAVSPLPVHRSTARTVAVAGAVGGRYALGHQVCSSVSVAICVSLQYPIFSDHVTEITKKC